MKPVVFISGVLMATTIVCAQSSLEGLSSAELADVIRKTYAPASSLSGSYTCPKYFDDGSAVVDVAQTGWWTHEPADLYNNVLGSHQFSAERGDAVPGDVENELYRGVGYVVGVSKLSGYDTDMWEPDASRKGDVARRIMYLAVMYPQELWLGHGAMMMADGLTWPLLSGYGSDVILRWHRGDKVDGQELAEVDAIADVQGNVNPFVAYPDLAEYLWGEKAGLPYVTERNRERTQLKAAYSIGADKEIDFYSPYVPEDARWYVDGKEVQAETLALSGLGVGKHTISFSSSKGKGSLLIKVTQ